jgi:DNA-binding Lrp family transcriptional regulator
MPKWTFITNHGAVLTYIASHPQVAAREIASKLGITERSVRRIVADLEASGYLKKSKMQRINQYEVNTQMPLRRSDNQDIEVGKLLGVLLKHSSW